MKQETKAFLFMASLVLSSSYCLHNLFASSASEVDDESYFTYEGGKGNGPEKWGELNPDWHVCNTGKFQSPIDLTDKRVNIVRIPGLWERHYKPAPAVLKNRGHDIMVSWIGDAGKIVVNGTDYKLIQCHWHTPSEHTINGTRHAMELHLVHQSSDGKLAATAVLYEYGQPDPFVSRLFHGIKSVDQEDINVGVIDPRNINYGTRKFFRYIGSLTVPPCTENVIWTVVKRARTISEEQVKALREAVHDGFETNARPMQQRHARAIWYYIPEENRGNV